MMCALIARGKFKPQLEFQAGTSSFFLLSGSYQLVPRTLDYKCENMGYVGVPEITCTIRRIQSEATKSLRI